MPIRIERIAEKDLTVFVVTGVLGPGEQLKALEKFYEGDPTRHVLWDFRKVEGERYFYEDVKEIVAFSKTKAHLRPPGKTAIVTSKAVDFGLARMAKSLSEAMEMPWEAGSFTSIEDAVAWLDVSYLGPRETEERGEEKP